MLQGDRSKVIFATAFPTGSLAVTPSQAISNGVNLYFPASSRGKIVSANPKRLGIQIISKLFVYQASLRATEPGADYDQDNTISRFKIE